MEVRIPVPVEPLPAETDDKRIWIGNLDSRLTEFHLVKVLKKFGNVKKFDFLFHKSGPLRGHPRGYCFVTYETKAQAEEALRNIHGKQLLSKTMVAKWANTIPNDDPVARKSGSQGGSSHKDRKAAENVKSQIHAIEAKLKAMERDKEDDISRLLLSTPPQPQQRLAIPHQPSHQHSRKPYERTRTR
ncbi:probable RNA-binding protein 18 [Ornithodoros turicata]|uniref:Probable RNA-binding protein 18 n=1 Tax=Ornithodoros turicata TaxID=34597 RepID=A0A2R5LHV3_9ACAR